MKSSSGKVVPRWSLLTDHGQVLTCVAADPDARLRDIAGLCRRSSSHSSKDSAIDGSNLNQGVVVVQRFNPLDTQLDRTRCFFGRPRR